MEASIGNDPYDFDLILCATQRLARSLRLHGLEAGGGKAGAVQVPCTATLAEWLTAVVDEALLCGDLDADQAPELELDALSERLLWEAIIRESLGDHATAALFDVRGLADAARQAGSLCDAWLPDFAPDLYSADVQRFHGWRREFLRRCDVHRWMTASGRQLWQTTWVERGIGRIPQRIALAGFDQFSPLEQRLIQALKRRGGNIGELAVGRAEAGRVTGAECSDSEAECRAAVQWAAELRARQPDARIGIVAPDLAERRAILTRLLDHVLDPAVVCVRHAQRPRLYNISLGIRLADVPPVATALALLRLAARPDAWHQNDFSPLLNGAYWSADRTEAEGRARFDALLAEKLPPRMSLEQVCRLAHKPLGDGRHGRLADHLGIRRLTEQLERLRQLTTAASKPRLRRPSAWLPVVRNILDIMGWPGEASLGSHDFQAHSHFLETLAKLAVLDETVGTLAFGGVVQRFAEACEERLFQPQTIGTPNLQVLGMLEAAGETFDGLWVMGMNDHLWPPPARPSPLLPFDLQREHGCPNATPELQFRFAQAIHRRLLHAAPELVFSWAVHAGETDLRPNLLVDGLAGAEDRRFRTAHTLGEKRLTAAVDLLEALEDRMAPPVQAAERIFGGTALFKTQAICPAWAFYRHRLGAKPIETPHDGLDARQRGSLLHKALEIFWTGCQGSEQLASLTADGLAQAVATAAATAIRLFGASLDAPLSPRFLALERGRLQDLLSVWIEVERQRDQPFTVAACEQRQTITLEGLAVTCVADRIDRLPDGRVLLLDYKTGADMPLDAWTGARLTEPQLPLYAIRQIERGAKVAGTAVARVRLREGETAFIGVTDQGDRLPGVKALEENRGQFPETDFPDWAALLEGWRRRLAAVAREIHAGEAGVWFVRERDLLHCEVRPLLRLPERRRQFERLRQTERLP